MNFRNHIKDDSGNKHVCPNDRQLALRAKLRTGWNSTTPQEPLKPEEQAAIISVIQRNEEIESAERQRVGRLVERVEKIKQKLNAVERGPNKCRLCGEAYGLIRPQRILCEDCRKVACPKCCLDINIRYHTVQKNREIWLCRICSETREMWKKTGAWFFKGIPNYEIPSSTSPTTLRNVSATVTEGLLLPPPSRIQGSNSSAHKEKIKKLTIHVRDSSSSEEEDDEIEEMKKTNSEKLDLKTKESTIDGNNVISKCVREGSYRLRSFVPIRNFIDVKSGSATNVEKRISNTFFFNNRMSFKTESQRQQECDANSMVLEDNKMEIFTNCGERRGSVTSTCTMSDSSSASSAILANQLSSHCRDSLLGWLEAAMTYREDYNTLDATVVRARDLLAMDSSGLADPYCKLNIITAEGKPKFIRWQRTRTVHKTCNPAFNETLQFVGVESEELSNAMLYVAIYDEDKYGNDFLGAAKIALSSMSNAKQYRSLVPLCGEDELSNCAESSQEWPHGKVLISLCYNTKKRALLVRVRQCINLIPMDSNGSSDPFIKLQLKPDFHRNKKYKTSIKWRTLNPIYNEEFQFEASPHDLNKQCLILTVWDKDLGKSNDFLGSLVIGHNSKGERLQQWLDCIRLPDHVHEKWHCLSGDNPLH
ncbi:synaptotagmin-like protein 4 isoform X1 [Glossina fuscipes]|uniref:Synaptotagmin-like protein 4 isoform X1 n=2 Tax=Glossina fuscipes TaxID=7396 RepID=A0A8U0W7R4_9MUSC|nr:synaptotagmin-like protein 4 isoform X1 [Glossina fuscipes]